MSPRRDPEEVTTTTMPTAVRHDSALPPPAPRPSSAPTDSTPPPPPPAPVRHDSTPPAPVRHDSTPPAATRHDSTPPPAVRHDSTSPTAVTRKPGDVDEAPVAERTPVVAGPKPRASLLATLSLILGVAGAMLVLSGPLLGWGIGVSGLALVLALGGIRATGKRHVAGKTDALIGMILALAAIVVGVLALTGSLSWLGTDMQPVNSLREWLDAQFANRF